MADDLDAELLALAGDSEEEEASPPQNKQHSPRHSSPSRHSLDRETSPASMGNKGTAKRIKRPKKKAVHDDEDDLASNDESVHSYQSAPMSESNDVSDADMSEEEDKPVFPYDKLYYSAKEKEEISKMPEIVREELLSERAQQVDRHDQDLALRRLLVTREREEHRSAKRKASIGDDTQRKSSRQKTTLGGRKVGETSGAMEAYKRKREQKGKRDELRRRDASPSRRGSTSAGSHVSDDDVMSLDSDLGDDRVGGSASAPKNDPPADLHDIQRARVGRSNFAQVCNYPGFEEAITGCYVRANIGPTGKGSEEVSYRLCLITGIKQGEEKYAMEYNGQSFITTQLALLAHGNSVRPFPFNSCSNQPITELEFQRYRQTLDMEGTPMQTKSQLSKKVQDIHQLINHKFTAEELATKLRRQGALDAKRKMLDKVKLQRQINQALADGDDEEVAVLRKQLEALDPKLSYGTSMIKEEGAPIDDVAYRINIRNQKLNHEIGRRAEIHERKSARKAAAAVARGEGTDDPFRRVRTVAKTHYDLTEQSPASTQPHVAAVAAVKPEKKKPVALVIERDWRPGVINYAKTRGQLRREFARAIDLDEAAMGL
ncbi:Plus-3 [Penicillium taxi]|uniref:Plus-3 n=1 Tax=Penicillium taxi TaxID=168475 RepID=UPI0025457DD8|nr:Plus-3 [Penicillium taxi]KAJ5885177.1 Plus-3 [Penicillium taxi]